MGGKKFRFEGQQFVDVESGKIATKAQASSLGHVFKVEV